jgi:hypothetical protein
MKITPEVKVKVGNVVKAQARKLSVKYTVDSYFECLPAGDDDTLIKAMSDGIREGLYEDVLFGMVLLDAGIFVV